MSSADYNDFSEWIARGDDRTLICTIALEGTPQNISGWNIWVTGKRRVDQADVDAVFQYTIGNGITVTNAAGGQIQVAISGADTDALVGDSTIFVDVQCKNGSRVWTAASGKIRVYRDVTRTRI